jgi:hypothetical protein
MDMNLVSILRWLPSLSFASLCAESNHRLYGSFVSNLGFEILLSLGHLHLSFSPIAITSARQLCAMPLPFPKGCGQMLLITDGMGYEIWK